MGRYCGEDYDRPGPTYFLCSRSIYCPEGHFVGMCTLPSEHWGRECLIPHPIHQYKDGCEVKIRAEKAKADEINAALLLLRQNNYSVRKLRVKAKSRVEA